MSSSTSTSSTTTINNEKIQQFMGKILFNFGGAASSVLEYIGDKFGSYKTMFDFGKLISLTIFRKRELLRTYFR
jgi:hypothetical protein